MGEAHQGEDIKCWGLAIGEGGSLEDGRELGGKAAKTAVSLASGIELRGAGKSGSACRRTEVHVRKRQPPTTK